jgi:membrane protease YdiL (CAAX protease family)
MFQAVLFDFDGTLVDFVAADIQSLKWLHSRTGSMVDFDDFLETAVAEIMSFHDLVAQMEYLIAQLPLFVSLGATIVVVHLIVRLRRLKPLTVTFPSPKSEALIALIPLLVLVALMALALWGAATTRSEPSSGMAAAPYTLAHALRQLALNLIIFLPFAVVMLVRKHGLRTIGLTRHNLPESTLVGIVSGVAAGAVYGMLSTTFWFSAETVHRVVAQLGVGFSEEAIFRGFLQTRFSA